MYDAEMYHEVAGGSPEVSISFCPYSSWARALIQSTADPCRPPLGRHEVASAICLLTALLELDPVSHEKKRDEKR